MQGYICSTEECILNEEKHTLIIYTCTPGYGYIHYYRTDFVTIANEAVHMINNYKTCSKYTILVLGPNLQLM